MNNYALYAPATGDIIAFFQCAPRNAALQARDGLEMLLIDGEFPGRADDFHVVDGEVVAR